MRIRVARSGQVLAEKAKRADSWWQRMVGLLAHSRLPAGEALILPRCNAIHTIGMRFAIDAIFVDSSRRVIALKPNLRPGRITGPIWRAWGVIEVPCGAISAAKLALNDVLYIEEE